ncbi:MAG: hypothetical protein CMP07_09050 [Xanthomonadales bacterium]|nr:hypothetical protein [Xanthomonadales bacterium]
MDRRRLDMVFPVDRPESEFSELARCPMLDATRGIGLFSVKRLREEKPAIPQLKHACTGNRVAVFAIRPRSERNAGQQETQRRTITTMT